MDLDSVVDIRQARPDHPDSVALIGELESHLAAHYPVESRHGFSVEQLLAESVDFFVLYLDSEAAGCAGIKLFCGEYGEVKRMVVRPKFRGSGLGAMILDHLAAHAVKHGIRILRLETGIYQRAAIRLYEQQGFYRIPPFGEYREDPLSRCYEKLIG